MPGRILLYGATGYTGRLTAEALLARGERPVLAGRDAGRLAAVAARLADASPDGARLETAVAGTSGPAEIRALIGPGDVLVSTAGPFTKAGAAAVEAAVSTGAAYLDSTGEPPFIRRVFEEFGPQAERSGAVLLTAFGHDYVPGNLAGALALAEAGERATGVDIGYFARGNLRRGTSAGTRASAAGVMLEGGYAFRAGRLIPQRPAAELRTFQVGGKARDAVSVGGSEQFALPRLAGTLRDVRVFIGWFGGGTRLAHRLSVTIPLLRRAPGARWLTDALAERLLRSRAEPDPAEPVHVDVVAVAVGAESRTQKEVTFSGGDPYTFTSSMLAWAASRAAAGDLAGQRGALGPVEAFGIDALTAACAEAGLTRR